MKKVLLAIIAAIIASNTFIVPVLASESVHVTSSPNAVVVREDVPHAIAITDQNYSNTDAIAATSYPMLAADEKVYWKSWGGMEWDDIYSKAKPIGYSEHHRGNAILSTYHYTRTYLALGTDKDKRGDSGRVWGYTTVKAVGSYCAQDIWDLYTHYVKYGTED